MITSTEELKFLIKERTNDEITGCLVCEYGHSKCTCDTNNDIDNDELYEDEYVLIQLSNDGSRSKESLVIYEGTYDECFAKYIEGEHIIYSKLDFDRI